MARSGGRRVLPRPRLRRGSLWLSQIDGGDRTNTNTITRIDPETGATHTLHLARAASGLAWSGAYGELWIDNFDDGSLTRLQPDTGAARTVDDVANAPAFPVVDGNLVWVGDWTGPQVVRLRAIGSPKPHRIDLPQSSTGVSSIAVGAGAVWATSPQDGALWRIDPKTGTVTRISIPFEPTGVAADANDVWVTVRK
jgi:streptogramin lyase